MISRTSDIARRAIATSATVMSVAVSGCASTSSPDRDLSRGGTQAVRTDSAPLRSRFSAIGPFVSPHWISGTLGDQRAPGPSTYFVRALVTINREPLVARADRRLTGSPRLPASLRTFLPPGAHQWYASDSLDTAASTSEWNTTVVLCPETHLAFIDSQGGGSA